MSSRLDDAFDAMPRAGFLPADVRRFAHEDRSLPIGHGATNSQPWTVRYMLTALDVPPACRVLDVGSGSGWTAALLGHLVGAGGSVIGVDIVADLVEMSRRHLGGRPRARTGARLGAFGGRGLEPPAGDRRCGRRCDAPLR